MTVRLHATLTLCTHVGVFDQKCSDFSALDEDADIDDDPVILEGIHAHMYLNW